jgi:hypothetical protein
MRLSSFAAVSVFTVGSALAPAVQANPGDPLTPAITIATVPGQPGLAFATLAGNPAGNFVVGWPSVPGFNGAWQPGAIYSAQAFDGAGQALSSPFPIIGDLGSAPVLAADSVGGFTVAWNSNGTSNEEGVVARRFELTGPPLTSEMEVSKLDNEESYLIGLTKVFQTGCGNSDVGTSPKGQFVVTWVCALDAEYSAFPIEAYSSQIAEQRGFLPDGLALLPEIAPSSDFLAALDPVLLKEGPSQLPLTAVAPNGSFMTAWSEVIDGISTIYVRRFDLLGLPLGLPATIVQGAAGLLIDADGYSTRGGLAGIALGTPGNGGQVGNYVLAWYTSVEPCLGTTFNVQGFDSSNQALGPAVSLATGLLNPECIGEGRQIATDAQGNFVIVSFDGQSLTAQFFLANGTPRTGVITLPITVTSDSNNAISFAFQVASDAAGNITVAWERYLLTSPQTAETVIDVQRFVGVQ